jgi:acetylornithine/succinyldiaminopimelate/putrescine aminotransferase/predicted amino acid dehydrogenase
MSTLGLSDAIFNEPAGGYRKALLDVLGLDMAFSHAAGDYLYIDDRAVYDGSAQYGTNIFGHNDPDVVATMVAHLQARQPNFVQPFRNHAQDELADRLIAAVPGMSHCVFANSGAEAVEAAIKLARLATRRRKIITLKGGFHGKTQLALSVSGSDRYSHPLICDRDESTILALDDLHGLEDLLDQGDVAAFLFEPVLGEGGMFAPDPLRLQSAIELCHQHGALVIADEIQCGLYRCGAFLASQRCGLDPDIVLLGKGLGGGLMPISAVLLKQHVRSREFDRKHSSTFAGGGLASAVANHVVARLANDQGLERHVDELSAYIDRRAASLGNSVKITGMGLMRGIYFPGVDTTGNNGLTFLANSGLLGNLVSAYLFHKHAVISLPLMSQACALRLEPALNTTQSALEAFFDGIADVTRLISEGRYDILFSAFLNREESSLPERGTPVSPYNNDDERCHPLVPVGEGNTFDFAFLSHLTQPGDVANLLPRSVREHLSQAEIEQITEMVTKVGQIDPSPAVLLSFEVGGTITSRRGLILSSLLCPRDLMRLPRRERDFLIDAYFQKAKAMGAKVVGLGAYTSVVTGGGTIATERFPEFCVTTGNTLTAASIATQLRSLTHNQSSVVAIIGARGSIGSLVTLSAARHARRLILIGRRSASPSSYRDLLHTICREMLGVVDVTPGSVAERIQQLIGPDSGSSDFDAVIHELCAERPEGATITVTDDYARHLCEADFVVSCSSEGKTFLTPDYLRSTAVVLDAARPFDFERGSDDEGPTVLESGLVSQPSELRYGDDNMLSKETGQALGCLSETIILSMEDQSDSFMIAQEPSLAMLERIEFLAQRHGFTLPGPIAPKIAETGSGRRMMNDV